MALFQEEIYTKLNNIEKEIEDLKMFVVKVVVPRPKVTSLKNLGKLLVSEKELDLAIEEAKKSLLKIAA